MFKKEAIQNFLYFDVETACAYDGYEAMRELNPRLAALWSKRANYYRGANPELSEAPELFVLRLVHLLRMVKRSSFLLLVRMR